MRIAIFRTDFSPVDSCNYNSQEIGLARGLVGAGHEVSIHSFSASAEKGSAAAIVVDGLPIRLITLGGRNFRRARIPRYRELFRLIRNSEFDLVHINEESNSTSATLAFVCRRCRIPYVVYQGMYRALSGRMNAAYGRVHAVLMRPVIRGGLIHAFAKTSMANDYLVQHGYERTSVLPVGVDLTPFEEPEIVDWRAKLKLSPDTRLLLYIGILEKRRNPDFLIALTEKLGNAFQLLIVGQGPEANSIVRDIDANGIENVNVIGPLPQKSLPSLYEQSDLFLLASDYEIYGMVVAEALSFGLDVVSTDTAGPRDMLQDERLGVVIETKDLAAWAAAVRRRCEDHNAAELKAFRRLEARRRFDWHLIASTYLKQLEGVIET